MTCTLDDPRELWAALLALRAFLRRSPDRHQPIFFARSAHAWSFHEKAPAQADVVIEVVIGEGPHTAGAPRSASGEWHVFSPCASTHKDHGHPAAKVPPFLQLYLPIVLASHRAQARGAVHVTGHLAQTLDGRIACVSGDSQWIGNAGNLRHAHRLRALHDAILVGRHTVDRDNPQLTVRHVAGTDPRRVVLNGSASTLGRQHELKVFGGAGCVLVCDRRRAPVHATNGTEILALDADVHGAVSLPALLGALAERGLHSLFVEGGGRTLSGFLAHGLVDLLHLHIAPIILGSGVPGFVLPEVALLSQARRMTAQHFDVDGEMLFACQPNVTVPESRTA